MSYFYRFGGKNLGFILFDVFVIFISYLVSFVILFYPDLSEEISILYLETFCVMEIIFLMSFYLFQIYKRLWVYSNIKDIYRLILANLTGFALLVPACILLGLVSNKVFLFFSFLLTCQATIFYRVLSRDYFLKSGIVPDERDRGALWGLGIAGEGKRILIVGAGEAGRMILSEYEKRGMGKSIAGFLDDETQKVGKILSGKQIIGKTAEINTVILNHKINEVIIAMPSVDNAIIDGIIGLVKSSNPKMLIKTLPPFTRMFEKSLSPDLRELGIADILGREEISIDTEAITEHFSGKTVLVTGAGGSIGREICRQLLKFNIKKLVAIGRGEYSIYNLVRSIDENLYYLESKTEVVYRIADVKDSRMLDKIFNEFKPDMVFHAAAHKHVPLMEFNEIEAVQNNIGGSLNVLDAASRHGVKEFVLVSTDKAVRPVNIMGATKRIAELIALYYFHEKGLKISIVRFGNVIGSRGSAIPLFCEQIKKGGPVTVTHPDVTRYFMSIPEASILLINAAAYSKGGEVFVLDMGKPYRVAEIAENLVRFYGYEVNKDIAIEFTGLRPGEKLYEELFYDKERLAKTYNNKIFILNNEDKNYQKDAIENFIYGKLELIFSKSPLDIRRLIKDIIPEYDFTYPPQQEHGKSRLVS